MRWIPALPAAALVLLLGACATPTPESTGPTEVDSPQPRLAVLHEDGVLVFDAVTLDELADIPVDGVGRVAEAGDGRHVMLTTESGFLVLDGGAWTDRHGDHGHSYVAEPTLTATEFPMDHPGHVVAHYGSTALFSDGAGTVTLLASEDLAEADPATRVLELADAHHGVAVERSDGVILVTAGTSDERRSVLALAPDGSEIARTDDCPGVHGEAMAAGEVAVFGCAGRVVVFEEDAFRSVPLPDADAAVADLRATDDSRIVLADYAVGDAPVTRMALIDLAADAVTVVDTPAPYYYWSLALAEQGPALVLGQDGSLHLFDPESGELRSSVAVIDPWTPPADWRDPAPTVTVLDGVAFVTDPVGRAIHVIDLDTAAVIASADLGDTVPHSLALVRG